jgi:hypothetical protein
MAVGHESMDLSAAQASICAALLIMLVSAVLATTLLVFHIFKEPVTTRISELEVTVRTFPEPRLQVSPHDDLVRLKDRERKVLQSYGWVDRERHIARMPIDKAIGIVVQQGLPEFPPESPTGDQK